MPDSDVVRDVSKTLKSFINVGAADILPGQTIADLSDLADTTLTPPLLSIFLFEIMEDESPVTCPLSDRTRTTQS